MRNIIKTFYAVAFLFLPFLLIAQAPGQSPEMADVMRSNGKIYVVVAVVSIIMTGLILYLVRLDRRISILEKTITGKKA